ncbi:protein FAR1-RELATED SEQUENCE 5-like [Chenopodium quinoa]|uniref:protein FAR1-RELATED SEQUENCE 5-like n=1 Tax=Chenopodium quinoa TaxID=63459 RepID=UPI000B7930D0|nr:protein FAR1-RELATED SEQUENCE 5-like [Chenopodium quinoa]
MMWEKENAFIFEEASQFDFWGKQFPFEDDAYEMYNEYAFMKGFGIRVRSSKRNMSESVEHCSSSVTTEDRNVRIFKTPTQPLLPKIYYNSGGYKEYTPCCSSENKPFLGMIFDSLQDGIAFYYKYANECGFKVRSSTTKSQKNKDDPTGAVMSYRIMKELCGGFQNVMGSKNDFKIFSRDLKVYISNADGATFVQNLERKVKTSKGGYFFDYCVDESRHLTCVFWADVIGRRDYQLFGDSLSFDSTYDTNKYSLIFCPFTGVDNHKRCVTFCAALFSKEDIDSFVWLFQNFLKCMGREPSCIITDQYPAMGIAIEKVFTKTKHRLCMWHIMRKVPEKVGTDFCKETDFLKKLSAVVWDREIVLMDLFMGGLLRSTSRSEGENSFFCNFTNPHVTCVEFFIRYETALDAQRHEQDELYMLNKLEPQLVTNLHLEKHAADIYTRAIFYDFQEECQGACFSCGVESCSSLYGDCVEFSVIVDHEKRKNFDVNFDLITYESSCTCRMFESQGVLCRHILFVMKGKCVREIPDAYILNRWRKDVLKKASVIDVALDDASKYDKKKQLVSDVWSKIFSCVSLTNQSEDDLSEFIKTLSSFEEQMIAKNNHENAPSSKEVKDANIQVLVGSNEVDVNVFPPTQCLYKGSARSSKRLKSAKEIATEEKSKKGRTCRACGQSGVSHDSRNCPNK